MSPTTPVPVINSYIFRPLSLTGFSAQKPEMNIAYPLLPLANRLQRKYSVSCLSQQPDARRKRRSKAESNRWLCPLLLSLQARKNGRRPSSILFANVLFCIHVWNIATTFTAAIFVFCYLVVQVQFQKRWENHFIIFVVHVAFKLKRTFRPYFFNDYCHLFFKKSERSHTHGYMPRQFQKGCSNMIWANPQHDEAS